jgi:hypothetical protein
MWYRSHNERWLWLCLTSWPWDDRKGGGGGNPPFPLRAWHGVWKLPFLLDLICQSLVTWLHQDASEPGKCSLNFMTLCWRKTTVITEESKILCHIRRKQWHMHSFQNCSQFWVSAIPWAANWALFHLACAVNSLLSAMSTSYTCSTLAQCVWLCLHSRVHGCPKSVFSGRLPLCEAKAHL